MRLSTKLSGIVALGGAAALAAGLISSGGIGAAFTDGATATADISVGSFGCELSAGDNSPAQVDVSTDKRSATIHLGELSSSAGGTNYGHVVLRSTGSVPVLASWDVTTDGNLTSKFTPRDAPGPRVLNQGEGVDLNGGFIWGNLDNDDLETAGSVTYTVTCDEVPARTTHYYTANGGSVNPLSNGNFELLTPDGKTSAAGIVTNKLYDGEMLPEQEPSFKVQPGIPNDDNPWLGIAVTNGTYSGQLQAYVTSPKNDLNWNVRTFPAASGITNSTGNDWSTIRATLISAGYVVDQVMIITNGSKNQSVTVTSFCFGTMHLGSDACGW